MEDKKRIIRDHFYHDLMNTLAFDENPARKHFLALHWAVKRYDELSEQERDDLYQELVD